MNDDMKRLPAAAVALVREVAEVAGILWERGWAESNAGNITVDLSDAMPPAARGDAPDSRIALPRAYAQLAGRCFLVTGSGRRMRDLARDPFGHATLLAINEDGTAATLFLPSGAAPSFAPTSELAAHLAIHEALRARGDAARTVLHSHATELIALTHHAGANNEDALNTLLWRMHPEAVIFLPEGVGLVPYARTGSEALAEATVTALARHNVVIWEKHGVLAVGGTPHAALDRIDIVAKSARIWFLCRNADYDPEGLSAAQVAELRAAFPPR